SPCASALPNAEPPQPSPSSEPEPEPMPATALLLADCINDFFDPQGSNYYPETADVVSPITRLLDRARQNDALIVHSVERHLPGLDDFEWRKLPEHCLDPGFERQIYPPFTPA